MLPLMYKMSLCVNILFLTCTGGLNANKFMLNLMSGKANLFLKSFAFLFYAIILPQENIVIMGIKLNIILEVKFKLLLNTLSLEMGVDTDSFVVLSLPA